ncbi:MAG: hypothetical protein ACTSPA_02255 [Promethearchaeota archaeon]
MEVLRFERLLHPLQNRAALEFQNSCKIRKDWGETIENQFRCWAW